MTHRTERRWYLVNEKGQYLYDYTRGGNETITGEIGEALEFLSEAEASNCGVTLKQKWSPVRSDL